MRRRVQMRRALCGCHRGTPGLDDVMACERSPWKVMASKRSPWSSPRSRRGSSTRPLPVLGSMRCPTCRSKSCTCISKFDFGSAGERKGVGDGEAKEPKFRTDSGQDTSGTREWVGGTGMGRWHGSGW